MSLINKTIKKYFKNIFKTVWGMIKSFVSNKGCISGEEIMLKTDNEIIIDR